MRICVLGSDGQIGKPLSTELRKLEHEVIPIDISSNPQFDLRRTDESWIAAISGCDFVFFLAYDVGGSKYLAEHERSKEFLDNNLAIMFNVFQVLSQSKIPFIFASSQMSDLTFSPYGTLKRIGEFYVKSLGGLTCRFWNVFGPESDISKSHVITDFIQMAIFDGVIRMRTNGVEERQFLYVPDCNQALISLMEQYESLNRELIYDISSYEWTPIKKIAEIVSAFTGCRVEVNTRLDSVQNGIKNEPNTNILNLWKPSITLEKAIGQLVSKELTKLNMHFNRP